MAGNSISDIGNPVVCTDVSTGLSCHSTYAYDIMIGFKASYIVGNDIFTHFYRPHNSKDGKNEHYDHPKDS